MKSLGTRFLLPLGIIAVLFSTFVLYQTYEAARQHASLFEEVRRQWLSLAAGLVLLFGLIFIAFRFVVARRLVFMARHFNDIAAHAESQHMRPVDVGGNDEITVVGAAFNRLLDQLRDSHASLEQRVAQRTEELQKANGQLQRELAERKHAEEVLSESEKEAKCLAQENAIVAEIGSIINSSLDIDEVYERFVEEVRKLISFDRISINLVNLKDGFTYVAYVNGSDIPSRGKGASVPLDGGFSSYIIETRGSLLIPTGELERYAKRFPGLLPSLRAGFQSVMSIPLVSKDQVIAILHFRSARPDIYTEKELRLAERVGYQITSAIVNAQTFSEHKRTEKALQESERRFKDLYDNAPAGYHEYNLEGGITQVNRTELDMLGYTKEEMLGRFVWTISVEEEEARKEILEKLAGSLSAGREIERTYRRKDGTTLPVLIKNRPFLDDQGRIAGMRSTIQDITERKKAEEERGRLQARLQRAEKMEAVGTLAGGVAHDLNNILSGIVSYPDLLLMQLPEGSRLRRPIAVMQDSGKRAAAIVQDLLTLARRAVPTTEVVNLNGVIAEYMKSPEREKLMSFHPQVRVETRLDKGLMNILGSPLHLSKTVMNLISNAAEAMPRGGRVLVSTENRYVESPIRGYDHVDEGDYVTLIVSDTGIGITEADRNRIFEPFYTKKVMGRSGTGLGMAVVWGTVKDHKGYIDVQSAEGEGTTFTLYFPVTMEERLKDRPSFSIQEFRGRGETILVVDDVEGQREIASALLSHLGYSVATVSSGEEALQYLGDAAVDLIVLDMIMAPGMDGLETYRRILEMHPAQKAVIASGFSETLRVKEAQRLGAGSYVKKPYTLSKLAQAVRKELDRG
ncbi:MAG: PAS domain S-box protein [Thermodesulfobacteriota bacterium]